MLLATKGPFQKINLIPSRFQFSHHAFSAAERTMNLIHLEVSVWVGPTDDETN